MYLMCSWKSALKDKSVRLYEQGTCVTSLDQHKPFCFKEHTLMILSHHFHVKTTWGFLLWINEPCRQLQNAWDSERNMYKTEAVTIPQSEFPSYPDTPSPTLQEFQPLSSVWSVRNLSSPLTTESLKLLTWLMEAGFLPFLPSAQILSLRGHMDHKKRLYNYQKST